MRFIKRLLRSAILVAIIGWFVDPERGAERRAKARDLATDAGRGARDGIRRLRAASAARGAAGRPSEPWPGTSTPEASAHH
jgi:hypothetical protein